MTLDLILSVLFLGALGWAVPRALMRALPDSLRGLAVALALSVPILALAGAGLVFAQYAWQTGPGVAASAPGAAAHFWHLGLRAALIWGPVLALTALALGTGIERRRGERMAARDPD